MQATRERILNIMKEHGQVTVDELRRELRLTAVTVRHHLDILQGEGFIAAPVAHRRKVPGRPKYVYTLSEEGSTLFPKRYDHLASLLLSEAHARLSPDEVSQMMRQIGEHIAGQFTLPDEDDFEARLAAATEFLDGLGYMANWEQRDNGDYLLRIANCPYEKVARRHKEVCKIDRTLLTHLLGISPRRIEWAAQGDHQCAYAIRSPGE